MINLSVVGNTTASQNAAADQRLLSPPHTLHSDNVTQSSQSQFDFRSTNNSRRDDERGNDRTIHLSITEYIVHYNYRVH